MLKTAVRRALRSVGYDIVRYDPQRQRMRFDLRFGLNVFELVVNDFLKSRPAETITLLQIGANDGMQQDPVRPILAGHAIRAVLVEPIPEVYERLCANYAGFARVQTVNSAIGVEDGTLQLFMLNPGLAGESSLVTSFDKAAVENFRRLWKLEPDQMIAREVPCLTVASILARSAVDHAHIAAVDTEGMDCLICNQLLDLDAPPEIIHFEYANCPEAEVRKLLARLEQMGYAVARSGLDITATNCLPALG
jgi:FkbM family methyltransferase